jgi:hypothetical protein
VHAAWFGDPTDARYDDLGFRLMRALDTESVTASR